MSRNRLRKTDREVVEEKAMSKLFDQKVADLQEEICVFMEKVYMHRYDQQETLLRSAVKALGAAVWVNHTSSIVLEGFGRLVHIEAVGTTLKSHNIRWKMREPAPVGSVCVLRLKPEEVAKAQEFKLKVEELQKEEAQTLNELHDFLINVKTRGALERVAPELAEFLPPVEVPISGITGVLEKLRT